MNIQASEKQEAVRSLGRKTREQRSLTFWKLEIASAVLALVALSIVIWILTKINGTPLSDWHYRVSPNAFLSIFITISKTGTALCLTTAFAQLCWLYYRINHQKLVHIDDFASAREGPFGSFLLLFKLELWGIVPTVARFGALTALLALAMDPFAQQILSFENREVVVPGNDTWVPSTNSFTWQSSVLANNGFQQALFGALLGIETPMKYNCGTGNCTYPDFVSLGFCSQCSDIDESVAPQCTSNRSLASGGCPSIYYNIPSYNLSLTLQNGSRPITNANLTQTNTFSLVKSAVSTTRPNGLLNTTLFEFIIAQLRVGQTYPNMTVSNPPAWNVSACSIRWCGKLYQNLNVVNGVLKNVVPKEYDLKANPDSACVKDGTCQEFLPANPSDVPPRFFRSFTASANQSFTIKNLLNIDSEILVTNNIIPSATANTIANTMLWNTDISTAMSRVITSMTDYVRHFINPIPNTGSAHRYQVYIFVHWSWFTLPAIVTSFSILFMLIVMKMTRDGRSAMWKASTVPLIMTGLNHHQADSDTHQQGTLVKGDDGVRVEVDEVRVQLMRDDNGHFRFKRKQGLLDDTDAR